MCGGSHEKRHGHGDSCGCAGHDPMLWCKKRRVEYVEHLIECRQEQIKDLHELLEELQQEG